MFPEVKVPSLRWPSCCFAVMLVPEAARCRGRSFDDIAVAELTASTATSASAITIPVRRGSSARRFRIPLVIRYPPALSVGYGPKDGPPHLPEPLNSCGFAPGGLAGGLVRLGRSAKNTS